MVFFYSFRYALHSDEHFIINHKKLLKNQLIKKKIKEFYPNLKKSRVLDELHIDRFVYIASNHL